MSETVMYFWHTLYRRLLPGQCETFSSEPIVQMTRKNVRLCIGKGKVVPVPF